MRPRQAVLQTTHITRLPRAAKGLPRASKGLPRASRGPFVPVARLSSALPSLSFQSLTTIKFSKPLVLITIRNAWGCTYPLPCPTVRQRSTSAGPLECALTSKHRVLPGFGRSCPSVSSLESAVTEHPSLTPLECALTKSGGWAPSKMLATERTARETSQLASFFSSTYNLNLRN